ncbi:hypothetical protein NDU88_006798, partial [Pleurodeles waltl]
KKTSLPPTSNTIVRPIICLSFSPSVWTLTCHFAFPFHRCGSHCVTSAMLPHGL